MHVPFEFMGRSLVRLLCSTHSRICLHTPSHCRIYCLWLVPSDLLHTLNMYSPLLFVKFFRWLKTHFTISYCHVIAYLVTSSVKDHDHSMFQKKAIVIVCIPPKQDLLLTSPCNTRSREPRTWLRVRERYAPQLSSWIVITRPLHSAIHF